MSLINDALKRAQSDVDRGRINPLAQSLIGARPRQKKKGSFLVILAIVLVVGFGGWAIALILIPAKEKEFSPVVATAPVAPVVSQAPAVEAVAVSVEDPIKDTVTSAPVEVVATPAPIVEVAETVVDTPTPLPVPAPVAPTPSMATVSEPAPQIPPAEDASMLKDEIIFTLKQLEITAVMGDGEGARIMTGGQVYRTGELINLDLKIRFMAKKGRMLVFSDKHDRVYEKNL
jgi:hypothetical protein